MRNIIISLCILGVFLEVSGLIWSSKREHPSETFMKLSEPPTRAIENPLENGYFLLLGFAASAPSNAVQTGYNIWLESDGSRSQQTFDFDKPGRSELRLPIGVDQVLPEWNADNPVEEFQRRDALFRTAASRYSILLSRYDQWLKMRFEDWGYAHTGIPRIEELLGAHRLYIAQGFNQHTKTGVDRLATDLQRWRYVLREARTLPMKVMAQVLIEDDVRLLSRILDQPAVDRFTLASGLNLLQPLTAGEYSLRWPVQSEFMAGYRRAQRAEPNLVAEETTDSQPTISLAQAAQLQPDLFARIRQPKFRRILGMAPASQRTWDTYATFYDATIKAAGSVHSPLPKLHDVVRDSPLTLLERVVNPLEFEPNWEPFSLRLVETDARLRLASLQILMRKPGSGASTPARLAEVGSMYFDPFTGFPMLWSPTQKKLYSVGRDGLDDGGDPTFDISVPLTVAMDASTTAGSRSTR